MRTGKITIGDTEYLLCFSARVMRACSERYGGLSGMDAALGSGKEANILDECFWMLAQMIDAGCRYAKIEGAQNPPSLTYDELYDACGIDDIVSIKQSIADTITNGVRREVETEEDKGKNAESAPKA